MTFAVLLAAAGVAAQEPQREAAAGASEAAAGPAIVRLDAVVTDRRGRPILDLKAADFELRAAGSPQPIASIELRRTTASTEAPGRTLALLLDEFHVSSGSNTDRVREMLLRFVDEQIRPQDRVIVMKPLDSQLAIPFVSDRHALRSAIETFSGRAGDYTPRTPFEQQYLGHAPEAVETARRQIVTAAIRALVTRLGETAAGRSAVAIVTEGVGTGGRSDRERRLPDLQSVARVASRFNVAVYAFDPSAAPSAAEDKKSGGLPTLAAETGGEAARGDRVSDALLQMMRDLDAYYLVTFTPSQRSDGRFHRVELSTKRAGASVRTRTGYWMPLPAPALTRSDAMPPPMRALRRSPHIESWYGLTRLPDGTIRMRITWEPGPRRSGAPEKQPAAVIVRAARRQGATLFEGSIARVGIVSASGAPQLAEFAVPTGRIELDLAVVAADGTRLDTETRDVDVPDRRSLRPSGLVPEIVRAATMRDFRALGPDPQAPPTPVRQFRRGDRLLVRVPAIGADGSRMAVSAKLLNRWGQPMRELAELPLSSDAVVQFDLPLAWLAAGEYEVSVTASSGGADTMHRIPIKVTG